MANHRKQIKRSTRYSPTGDTGGLKPDEQQAFIEEYAKDCAFCTAAFNLKMDVQRIERTMELYPDFALQVEQVQRRYVESLEVEAYNRAVKGWEEPVYYKGMVVGTINRRSDRLLELMLKANDKKYRDGTQPEGGAQGGVLLLAAPMTPEMWRAAAEQMRKQQMALAIGSEKTIDQQGNEIVRA